MRITNSYKIFISLAAGTVLASGVGAVPSAQAFVISNGPPNLTSSRVSDFEVPRETADNFTLNSLSRITKITWSGVYGFANTPAADNFSIQFFNANGSVPATSPLFTAMTSSITRVDSGLDLPTIAPSGAVINLDVYNYQFNFTNPFILDPGNYLLSIVNNTISDTDDNWFWARSFDIGNSFIRTNPTDPWGTFDPRPELSFTIEGTTISPPPPPPGPHPGDDTTKVPTPALLPGLLGLGLNLWRQRQKADSQTTL